ncbi:MAG: aminotransferase class V-fold PLP-dependent enzyme [Bacteroidales bacterium]|nr:aminotransferase class V-fold PLP-dependent enzyme [Bacteroidales bacterium]
MKKKTIAIQSPFPHRDAYGAIAMPVYHTDAYEFENATIMADAFCGRINEPDYSRVTNPTVINLEDRVKMLTNARDVIAVNSGMAAISNVLITLASAGKNIVTSRHLFGNTFALISKTLTRFGIECRAVDLINLEEVKKAVDENTCCLFFEIMTNPQLEVADTKALSEIAHKFGVPVVADTTVIPFTEFYSHSLGVDIEVISSTKYISGGATTIGGLIIDYGTIPDFQEKMRRETLMNLGAYMTPHVAYMQTLGLENLNARYTLQSKNTLELATKLRTLKEIKKVNYVGFEDNPFHSISVTQYGKTAGAMMTIDLESEQACFNFLNKLKLVKRATNLFDNKTLAIHPASTIFGPFTAKQRAEMDVFDTTIRLSVGLEDVDDLFEDIKQALQ